MLAALTVSVISCELIYFYWMEWAVLYWSKLEHCCSCEPSVLPDDNKYSESIHVASDSCMYKALMHLRSKK